LEGVWVEVEQWEGVREAVGVGVEEEERVGERVEELENMEGVGLGVAQAVTVKEEEGVVERVGETDWLRLSVEKEQGVGDAERVVEEDRELLNVAEAELLGDCVEEGEEV